jgi:hypothetical protein
LQLDQENQNKDNQYALGETEKESEGAVETFEVNPFHDVVERVLKQFYDDVGNQEQRQKRNNLRPRTDSQVGLNVLADEPGKNHGHRDTKDQCRHRHKLFHEPFDPDA